MGSADRARLLREQADALEEIGDLEDDASALKAAYREDPTPENRERHRAASQTLSDARERLRSSEVRAVDNTPGSTTIQPGSIGKGA